MSADVREIFGEYIRKAGLNWTNQRGVILDAFLATDRHVSVDDLHHLLDAGGKKVGSATIYRTMKLIADSGLAREVVFNDGISRFEHTFDSKHHHHLVCTNCGMVIEFSSDIMHAEEKAVVRRNDFEPQSHRFEIFGLCRACQTKLNRRKQ